MNISLYSLFMAVVWSSLFVGVLFCFRRNNRLVIYFGVFPLLFLALGIILRSFIPVEFPPFTHIIELRGIFAEINHFLNEPLGFADITPLLLLGIIWVAGFLFLLVRFFIRYFRYIRKLDLYEETDDPQVVEISEKIAKSLGISCLKIYETGSTRVPLIVGFLKPRILLPTYNYSKTDYEYIFSHELIHWKNHDLWVKLLIEIISDLFWWNPIIYLLKRDLSQTLEIKCDLSVVGNKSDAERLEYLETIKKTIRYNPTKVEKSSFLYTVSELSKADGNELVQRTDIILNYKPNRKRSIITLITTMLISCMLFVLSYAFIFQPQYDPPQSDITEGGCKEFTKDNAYLVKESDGSFWLYVEGIGKEANANVVNMLIEDGFTVKESGGKNNESN